MSEYTKKKSQFVKLVYFFKEKTDCIKNKNSYWEYVWRNNHRDNKNTIHYNVQRIDSVYIIYDTPRKFIVISCRGGDTYFVDIDYKTVIENSIGYEIS